MVSFPPVGMASRAFTARFISTCSSCPTSALTEPTSGSSLVARSTSSPMTRRSIFSPPDTPARQPAHRLHLLRLHQLLLQATLLGDVADERLVILDLPVGVAHRAHAELHRQQPAVLSLPGRLDFVVFAIGVAVAVEQTPALG